MTFLVEYLEQRYIIPKTTLRRECMLPEDVIGNVLATEGQRVENNSIVARGKRASQNYILEAAKLLRLRKPEQLEKHLSAEPESYVQVGELLARRGGRRVTSPVEGVFVGVFDGRIIIKETPQEVDLVAGMAGRVVEVREGRGVVIETGGAVLQGVWGNNRRAIGPLRMEPNDGMEFIEGDRINTEWNNAIVVTRRPLSIAGLVIMETQNIAGVIAPSMDATLLDVAFSSQRAILLTEGFGQMNMSNVVLNMLTELVQANPNAQTTMDAVTPSAVNSRRPDVLITVPLKEMAAAPSLLKPSDGMSKGSRVRITRAPYNGQVATVRDLPRLPVALENGLAVRCAIVELAGGEQVPVPIANLELFAG